MDALDVLKIFLDEGVEMGFTQAMDVADRIKNYHDMTLLAASDKSYTAGYEAGKVARQIQLKNEGLTLEKSELVRLRGIEDFAYNQAREAAPKIVKEIGKLYKITCIKRLRNDFPFLSLKDAKDMIDAEVKKIEKAEEAARLSYENSYSYDSYDSYGCGWDCGICNPR